MAYGTVNVDKTVTSWGDTTGGLYGFKNRIINGAMMMDQRNVGASVNPTDGQYTLDRWQISRSQASKLTVQQNAGSVTPPSGFASYLGVTSSSAYSVISSDYFILGQNIEGFNSADFGWGTSSAATVTLSFWVRSSLTGTFGGALNSSGNVRSYPFTYTINSANTWEQKSITIAGDTSGTWLTSNGIGVSVRWGLGVGSSTSGTAGSWATSALFSVTGATSVVGTNGATFYITGVQLEKGSTATSFDYRPYGTELALCQRYYQKSYSQSVVPGTSVSLGQGGVVAGGASSGTGYVGLAAFKQTMRATPTATIYDNAGTSGKITTYVASWTNNTAYSNFVCNDQSLSLTNSTNGYNLSYDYTVSAEL